MALLYKKYAGISNTGHVSTTTWTRCTTEVVFAYNICIYILHESPLDQLYMQLLELHMVWTMDTYK